MENLRVAFAVLCVSLLASNASAQCRKDLLDKNLEWCFQDASNDGFAELVDGACKKDAEKVEDGWSDCQNNPGGSDGNRSFWPECTAGEKIDHARAAAAKLKRLDLAACQ